MNMAWLRSVCACYLTMMVWQTKMATKCKRQSQRQSSSLAKIGQSNLEISAISRVMSIWPRRRKKRWASCGPKFSKTMSQWRTTGRRCHNFSPRGPKALSVSVQTRCRSRGSKRPTLKVLLRRSNGFRTITTRVTRVSTKKAPMQWLCASRRRPIWRIFRQACSPRWPWSSFATEMRQGTCLRCPISRARTPGISSGTRLKIVTSHSTRRRVLSRYKLCRKNSLRATDVHSQPPSHALRTLTRIRLSWSRMPWRLHTSSSSQVHNTSKTKRSSTMTAIKLCSTTNLSDWSLEWPCMKCMHWQVPLASVATTSRLRISSCWQSQWLVNLPTQICTSATADHRQTTSTGLSSGDRVTRTPSLRTLGSTSGETKCLRVFGPRPTRRLKNSLWNRSLNTGAPSPGSCQNIEMKCWKPLAGWCPAMSNQSSCDWKSQWSTIWCVSLNNYMLKNWSVSKLSSLIGIY